jgi:predicted ATPase
LHARIADAIERLYPAANERAGDIADHLLKAGSFADDRKLVRWLTLAGKGALHAAAFEEAWRSFESTLSHQGAVDPIQRADLLARLAMAERGLDQWGAALAHLGQVIEVFINLDDREMIGRSFIESTDAFI